MNKNMAAVVKKVSLQDFLKPKKLVSQQIKINGLSIEIARPLGSKPLPTRFKSFF